MELTALQGRLACLTNCNALLDEELVQTYWYILRALTLEDAQAAAQWYARFYHGLKALGYAGFGDYLWDWLRYTDTPYGLMVERGEEDASLRAAMVADVEFLRAAATTNLGELLPGTLPLPQLEWTANWDLGGLTDFYRKKGCGLFARYRAFRWRKGSLIGISEPDSPQPWELWGYAQQRQQVRENALALLEGRQVNHVLLYGDSGTGKSATVKSLLAQEGLETLRIVELDKGHLEDIPDLVRLLEGRAQKFILFIDDLAFDADDKAYSQLKTILEGSLEKQPDNVVVYATSNRRNLVKQNFSDRNGDELDRNETIAEKTSLAERFGVRIAYFALTPREFWQMVEDLAPVYGLKLDRETLLKRCEQWELRHPGRTPRIAKQFIAYELERQK